MFCSQLTVHFHSFQSVHFISWNFLEYCILVLVFEENAGILFILILIPIQSTKKNHGQCDQTDQTGQTQTT